jgi:hypothetical protein
MHFDKQYRSSLIADLSRLLFNCLILTPFHIYL